MGINTFIHCNCMHIMELVSLKLYQYSWNRTTLCVDKASESIMNLLFAPLRLMNADLWNLFLYKEHFRRPSLGVLTC